MVPVHMSDDNENDPHPAIRGENVTLAHGAHVALDDATFSLPAGRATAIIGPNASGKSTLLHAIGGLHEPTQGTIEVDAPVAYVPQHLHANEQLPISAREVVTMGRYAHRGAWGRMRADDRAAVDRAMERTGVTDLGRRQLGELSGGQRQRVLVAQALAQEATILLLDEPLTGLDLPSQERILEVLGEERDAGNTVVASTHSLTEASGADHLILLAGRVVAQGPPADVLTEQHLTDAYGEMVVKLGEGLAIVDDTPHHHPN
jgi:ABC-type Mn2+/Zn2+ transport system ATPase subunit